MKVMTPRQLDIAIGTARVTEVIRASGGARINIVDKQGPQTIVVPAGSPALLDVAAVTRGDALTDFGQADEATGFTAPRVHIPVVGELV